MIKFLHQKIKIINSSQSMLLRKKEKEEEIITIIIRFKIRVQYESGLTSFFLLQKSKYHFSVASYTCTTKNNFDKNKRNVLFLFLRTFIRETWGGGIGRKEKLGLRSTPRPRVFSFFKLKKYCRYLRYKRVETGTVKV